MPGRVSASIGAMVIKKAAGGLGRRTSLHVSDRFFVGSWLVCTMVDFRPAPESQQPLSGLRARGAGCMAGVHRVLSEVSVDMYDRPHHSWLP